MPCTSLGRSPSPERLGSTWLLGTAEDMSDACTCFDLVVGVRHTVNGVVGGREGRLNLPTAQRQAFLGS